jgi:predicted hotdog family 3-hydroxylacyl-ACP dehydratase
MMPAPFGREVLRGLIPHAGAMCLLDSVLEYDAEYIVCETGTHRDPVNPLRNGQGLSALTLAEYAAQAMAAHGALLAEGRAQPGMLAALRGFRLHVETIHDIPGNIRVRAQRRLARKEGLLYEFSATDGARLLAEGRISIALG